jgi:hypothetical protein
VTVPLLWTLVRQGLIDEEQLMGSEAVARNL